MSGPVIIRLQNLPLEARSIDIRRFFEGLLIPDGGVHIIGGERGDAFIAFQSDEDARLAMARDGYLLCSTKIKLFLSSKTEMQNVIAAARNQQPVINNINKSIGLLGNVNNSDGGDLFKSNNLSQIINPSSANSIDLLSSLTKIISSSSSTTNNSNNTPNSLMQNQIISSKYTANFNHSHDTDNNNKSHNTIYQTKATNELNTDSISSLLAKVNPSSLNLINKPNNNNSNENKSNISIDHILNLLQNHIQQPSSSANSASQIPSILSGNLEPPPSSSSSSSSSFNNYSQDKRNFSNNQDERNSFNTFNNRYNNNNNNGNGNFNPKYQNNRNRFDNNDNNNSNWRDNNTNDKQQQQQQQTKDNGNIKPPYQRTMLDPIIKVKNFNSNCSYKDIRTFLQGIQIEHDGIKLLTDPNGHRNGTAFVKLMTITDLKKALCRNGQFYEEKSINVSQSSESEFTDAPFVFTFKNNNNNNNNKNYNVRNKKKGHLIHNTTSFNS